MSTDLMAMTVFKTAVINGRVVNVISAETSHSVDRPIGTASLEIPTVDVDIVDINMVVTVQAGYIGGESGIVFSGKVAEIDRDFDDSGKTMQVRCEGWARQLQNEHEAAINLNYVFQYLLVDVFRYLCSLRAVPMYLVDQMKTYPSVTYPFYLDVRIAGVLRAGPESNVIPPRTSLLGWMAQKARMFGYRAYDRGDGMFRVSRVAGTPTGSPVATFTEGVNIFRVGRSESTSEIVNNWTVEGARFIDGSGVTVQIRNVPAVVPFNPDLDPPGYRSETFRDAWIVNDENALVVRSILEIDRADRRIVDRWETWGRPLLFPGQEVSLVSPSTNPDYATDDLRWVMSVSHRISDNGIETTVETWAGSGIALPAADDCATISIGGGATFHIGDMVRTNFDIPTPYGTTYTIPFTVPNTYTSMAIQGYAHGCNHGSVTSSNHEPRSLSKLEVWQGAVRVSSVDLPVFFDSLTVDYSAPPTNWEVLRMPLPGSLVPGAAEIRLTAGEDVERFVGFEYDDYEVQGLQLVTCGIGTPVLP